MQSQMTPCPLTQEHCDALNFALAEVARLRPYVVELDKLGLNVSDLLDRLNHIQQFCSACKATFFPSQP